MARTDTLGHFLTDVAEAIRTAEGSTDTITASDFDTRIESLSGGGGSGHDWSLIGYNAEPTFISDSYDYAKQIYENWDVTQTSLYGKYNYDCQLTIFPKVDTSNVTNFSSMFQNARGLKEVDLDITSATNISNIFSNCFSLQSLKIKGGQNITSYNNFCSDLYSLQNVNFSEINTSNMTSMSGMFQNCRSLKNIDLRYLDTSRLQKTDWLFYDCRSLSRVDMRNFDFTTLTDTSYMFSGSTPTNCEIIVADQTQKTWMNSHFSSYTNVKTVAEYEAE